MPKACILIKTVPTATDKILEGVKKTGGVNKAYSVYGRWDIVAFVDAQYDEIGKISTIINSIDGVRTSETLPEA
jgi:uncharacterized protein with GYD domain